MKRWILIVGIGFGVPVGLAISHWAIGPIETQKGLLPKRPETRVSRGAILREWIREKLRDSDTVGERSTEELVPHKNDKRLSPYRDELKMVSLLYDLPLDEVIALIEGGKISDYRELETACRRWAEVAPQDAWGALVGLSLREDKKDLAMRVVLKSWIQKNPNELLAWLEGCPKGAKRVKAVSELIFAWTELDPEHALQYLDRLGTLNRDVEISFGVGEESNLSTARLRERLLTSWFRKDPDAVERWVDTLSNDNERAKLREEMLIVRLNSGPAGEAVIFILNQQGNEKLQKMLSHYCLEWVNGDPVAAVQYMGNLPDNQSMPEGLISAIAVNAMGSVIFNADDPEVLIQSLEAIKEGARKTEILLGMVIGATLGEDSKYYDVAQLALGKMPEGGQRVRAVESVIDRFEEEHAEEVENWLGGLKPSTSRDVAYSHYADAIASEKPSIASEWVDAVSDPSVVGIVREKIYSIWVEKEPEAANAWKGSWE